MADLPAAPTRRALLALAAAFALVLLAVGSAQAAVPPRPPIGQIKGEPEKRTPPPESEIEDACGVATDSEGDVYVADYYHRTIDVFAPEGRYLTQIADPDPDGPCNLAVDAQGDVYVNNWHRDVTRFSPSSSPPGENTPYGAPRTIDFPSAPGARSTGIALDPASGTLYVDDRTYLAVYDQAALAEAQPQPSQTFGLGVLGQGYGVAVSDFPASEGDLYVPDASIDAVRVFDPSGTQIATLAGAGTPQRGFISLLDSDVAVDPTDGHLLVADDVQPGLESPAAVVDEFNAAGEYRGQLTGFVEAAPSALAITSQGVLFVSSGNTEGAAVKIFGPTEAAHRLAVGLSGAGEGTVSSQPVGIECGTACAAEFNAGEEVILTAIPAPGSAFLAWTGCKRTAGTRCTVVLNADTAVSAEFGPAPVTMALAAPAAAEALPAPASAAAPTASPSAAAARHRPAPRRCAARRRCDRKHRGKGRRNRE